MNNNDVEAIVSKCKTELEIAANRAINFKVNIFNFLGVIRELIKLCISFSKTMVNGSISQITTTMCVTELITTVNIMEKRIQQLEQAQKRD